VVRFVLLDPDLPAPVRARDGDGAVDLHAREDLVLEPGAYGLVRTGLAVAVPYGWGGFVLPRSGLALKHGISVLNAPGLVDAGYRGEVGVVLVNHGATPFTVTRGDRIAQLAVLPVLLGKWAEVEDLDATERGAGGFGSSGVSSI
jgi:dUTP pyrophosphatase